MDDIKREQIDQFAIELIPVEEWLRNGAQHEIDDGNFGFNMTFMYNSNSCDYKKHPCGTAMCIAGAAGQFNKLANPASSEAHFKNKYPEIRNELESLFYPTHWVDKEHGKDITPEQALQAIENFKDNGNPLWWVILGYDGPNDYRRDPAYDDE